MARRKAEREASKERRAAADDARGPLDKFARRLASELPDPMSMAPEEIRRVIAGAAGEEGLGPATSDVTVESVYDDGEWRTRVRIDVHL